MNLFTGRKYCNYFSSLKTALPHSAVLYKAVLRRCFQLGTASFILSLLFLNNVCAENISKDFHKAARRYRFKIRQDAKFPANINGVPLPAKDAEKELVNFFDALNVLGEGFVKKSGLNQVVICRDLKLNGMACAGVAYGDCMYLAQGATAKVVFHEIFHIFDPKRKNKDWTDLNNSKFRYWGINYPDRPQSEDKRREISQYYKSVGYKFAADFVSNYAQTNEVEDRAETFAAMLDEGEKFRLRVQKSRVLYNKMHFIISMTGRRYKLGKKFWQKTLGSWAFE